MNELYCAIIADLCRNLTQVIQIQRADDEHTEIVAAAKKALVAAQEALKVAEYYAR